MKAGRMYKWDLYAKARRAVMVENQSKRATAKWLGIHRKTICKTAQPYRTAELSSAKIRRYHRNSAPSSASSIRFGWTTRTFSICSATQRFEL